MATDDTKHDDEVLVSAGLSAAEVNRWRKAAPRKAGRFAADRKAFAAYWATSSHLKKKVSLEARAAPGVPMPRN